ncbi:uncharacterized protein [Mytilus edulis]|uniref:uncharacterized protein n=1 Tax=Mytilus edulis TaxID=6550 RepID=UPI0039F02742
MASSFDHCGVCTSRHVSELSVVWCQDCDEGLCQDCTEHHSLSKSSRNHKTVPIDTYHKLPSFIANINLNCDEHDEKYLLFCKKHNAMLCRKCVISENHAECKEICPVEDVIQNAKTSVAFTEIESSFQEMNENLKLILEEKQQNVSSLSDWKQKLESEISAIRRQINQHLDNIQDHFIAELNKAVEKSTQQIQTFIASLKKTQREIDDCIEDVESIKNHATDMQTSIATKLLETKLNKTENDMQSWINDGSLAKTVISYELNTVLNRINEEITTFGKPVVDVQSCQLSLQRRKEGQAQLMKVNVECKYSVEQIKLELKARINTSTTDVSGCCISPGGKLVVANFKPSYLILLSSDGKIEKKIENIIPGIHAVTCIDNETVAVTSIIRNNIELVSLKSGKVFRSIPTHFYSIDLAYIDGKLIVCPTKGQLQEISLDDTNAISIGSTMISTTFFAAFGNSLYCTESYTNAIVCQKRNGDKLWTFTDNAALKGPKCITIDEHGNIFVIGGESRNVIAIASDGIKHKILLSESELCGSPWAIDYISEFKTLLVANEKDG